MIQNCISTEDHNNVSIGNLYQTNSTLNISLLNVCGLLSKQDVPDFIQFIQSNSINCVVETKLNEIDVANLILPVGYQAIFKCRHFCSLSKSGGIGIIYKECLNGFIQEVKTNSSFVSWFIINKVALGLRKDLILGVVYIPPVGSKYTSVDAFEECQLELVDLLSKNDALVCMCGDFNARTAQLDDIVHENMFNNFDNICTYYNYDVPRLSNDGHFNNYGHLLLNMCKTNDLLIVNGRIDNETRGNFTFRNISTIDYFLCSPYLFKHVSDFIVNLQNPILSDGHCALQLKLALNLLKCTKRSKKLADAHNAIVVARWDCMKKQIFETYLKESANAIKEIYDDMNILLQTVCFENGTINSTMNRIKNVIIDAATGSGMVKSISNIGKNKMCSAHRTNHYDSKRTADWFDENCKKTRHEFAIARRRCKDNICENNIKQVKFAGKQYKLAISRSKAIHHKTFLDKLKSIEFDDPKSFWSMLNNPLKHKKWNDIGIEDFFHHFSKLNSMPTCLHLSCLEITPDLAHIQQNVGMDDIDEFSDILNSPITDDEIKISIKSLKNGKACGIDNITNEMIKCFSVKNLHVLRNLFNMVLESGEVPHDWLIGIIKPIYKNKGDINDPDNYRGITLLSCIGKLFTSILNNRLTLLMDSYNIISEAQAGFRKGYSTIDHIYTLKCIVDVFLCQGRLLFCTFINVIKNLYRNIKSCVMNNGHRSSYFDSYVGVRQGENLSPMLFALFLNDIESFSLNMKCNTLNYIDKLYVRCTNDDNCMLRLFVLLYADDTVIMAESEASLQRNLDILKSYCDSNHLKVNMSKTKVVVFSKSKLRLRNLKTFKFGDASLERVDEYIYLGITFNWNGSFTKAVHANQIKAYRAMYALIQNGRRLRLPSHVMLNLFDKCVVPILLYGCEVWGYENVHVIELVHTKFCKFIFGVSKFTHNMPVYGELGRYPLSILIKKRMLKYWTKILNSDKCKLNRVLYDITYDLYGRDLYTSSWLKCIKETLQNNGMNFIWLNQDPTLDTNLIVTSECDMFKQLWHSRIAVDEDMRMYKLYKYVHCCELYINELPEYLKLAMFQFRIGSRHLPTNNYTNSDVTTTSKMCTACNKSVTGDEFHFLFKCEKLKDIRLKYLPVSTVRPLTMHAFINLLQNSDKTVLIQLSKFIKIGLKRYIQ